MRSHAPLLLGFLLLAPALLAEDVELRDGLVVDGDVRIRPGTYRLPDAGGDGILVVRGAGGVVDLTGVVLDGAAEGALPDGFRGVGIVIDGAADVTIRGGTIRGFKVGVLGQRADRLVLDGVESTGNFQQRLRSTPEREAGEDWLWPHHNDGHEWRERYGAAIYLDRCAGATVARCRGRGQQNGIVLSRSDGARVYDNDFSYHSGWGLALWRTNRAVVSRNRFDWCVRGYSHGVYHRGQDSAGILVFEQCSDNVFAFNSATHGGDGFFLYAGHETTQRTGTGGCNRNVVYGNDFSHAVANGIEATFSDGNRFVANVLDECDYGIWAGYSRNTLVQGNRISRSLTAGVAIEHGHGNVIAGNSFEGDRVGVWAWWDDDRDLLAGPFGKAQDTSSRGYLVHGNRFRDVGLAVRLERTTGVRLVANAFDDAGKVLRAGEGCEGVRFEGADRSALGPRVEGAGVEFVEATGDPPPPDVSAPEVPGELEPFLPAGADRGRATMRVGEWGPIDPARPALFPSRLEGGREAKCFLLGPAGLAFEAAVEGEGVRLETRSGTLPATLVVRADGQGWRAFRLAVRIGDESFEATGSLFAATWDVRHHAWTFRGPQKPPADWDAVVATDPFARAETDSLDLVWGGGGPAGRPDHFATVARTRVDLPAGRYAIRTISDDGVRVKVGGRTVLENWTWHGPTEDRVELDLAAGTHEIVVEHFEIDGHAELRFRLER